jgi:phytoene/squalene synthetase
MKALFDTISQESAKTITKTYSTSFSIAVHLLSKSIRQDIYNIYGFVRVADEIVDTFEGFPKEELLNRFEEEYYYALKCGISTNPVINAFQKTVTKYAIDASLVKAFLSSMRADLSKQIYQTEEEINEYIYGSADVVGLMCLKVFVKGDKKKYEDLKESAMKLGSAFQKVNFLRDLKDDYALLGRAYFPNIDFDNIDNEALKSIKIDIEENFKEAFEGIRNLPLTAKFGVYVAYIYYKNLFKKMYSINADQLLQKRIRISNPKKIYLLSKSFIQYKLNYV